MDDTLEEVQQQSQQNQINLNLLSQQLGDIRADLRAVRDVDLREVRNQVGAMNRPDRATLISLGLFIILCGAGLWGLAIKPVNEQLGNLATKEAVAYLKESLESKVNGLSKDASVLQERVKEQENKFITKEQLEQFKYETDKRFQKVAK